jgi:hypothetical protein
MAALGGSDIPPSLPKAGTNLGEQGQKEVLHSDWPKLSAYEVRIPELVYSLRKYVTVDMNSNGASFPHSIPANMNNSQNHERHILNLNREKSRSYSCIAKYKDHDPFGVCL